MPGIQGVCRDSAEVRWFMQKLTREVPDVRKLSAGSLGILFTNQGVNRQQICNAIMAVMPGSKPVMFAEMFLGITVV